MEQELEASIAQEGAPVYGISEPFENAKGVFIDVKDFQQLWEACSKLEYALAIRIMPFLEKARIVKDVKETEKN